MRKPRATDGRVKIFDMLKIRGSPSFPIDLLRHFVRTLTGWVVDGFGSKSIREIGVGQHDQIGVD
jgi:hypothetical protein